MEMKYSNATGGVVVTTQSLTTTSPTIGTSMSAVLISLCDACCRPICDRYIMRVTDISFHENCLQCTSCSLKLSNSCFVRDRKIFCRLDYER